MIRLAIEKSGGRRFVLAMGAGITTTLLQWFGKLDADGNTFMLVTLGTVGAYLTVNTTQRIKGEAQRPMGEDSSGPHPSSGS